MSKFVFGIVLWAGVLLNLAVPRAQADPIVESLPTAGMSTTVFNSLFTPTTTTMSQSYSFMNTGAAGTIESQEFTGTGAATGLFAYAYQVTVGNATDTSGTPTSVNSASIVFGDPVVTNFMGSNAEAYVVTSGQIGGISSPQGGGQAPSTIAWVPGSPLSGGAVPGALTFQYMNPATGTGPLAAGSTSATIIVLSNLPYTQEVASLQNANPQTAYPAVYAPDNSFNINPVPAPEPTTILGWCIVTAAAAVAHRFGRRPQREGQTIKM
jgi:hypothetical protein